MNQSADTLGPARPTQRLWTLKRGLLFLASLTLLFLAFQFNALHTISRARFELPANSEDLVAVAILRARAQPMGHAALLPGLYPYQSQVGAQGYLFSYLDALFRPKTLAPFRAMNALLLALLLSLLIAWMDREFNRGAAVCLLLSLLYSKWLVPFSSNLYWMTWTWYAPMLAVGCILAQPDSWRRYRYRFSLACYAVAGLSFLKCVTGYEYISAVLVAAATPVAYYGIVERWSPRTLLLRVAGLGASGAIGFAGAVVIHAALIGPTLSGGFSRIANDAARRTYSQQSAADYETRNLNHGPPVSLISVLGAYLLIDGPFENHGYDEPLDSSLREQLQGRSAGEKASALAKYGRVDFDRSHLLMSFLSLFVVFSCAGVCYWFLLRRVRDRSMDALLGALTFSVTAPLSWYVLAKLHSMNHTHLNFVLWQLPFTLVGFAFVGSLVWRLASRRRAPVAFGGCS